MAYFEGIEMTGGYGNGPDIISSCSVSVNKGEIVSILGPNGAGKSTAMKAMLGLLNLKSGSVKIDGKDISSLMFGEEGASSPYDAFFYYGQNNLRAVRSGKWKLHLDTGMLVDLEADIGETTDVSGDHPDVVAELNAYAERCRQDLGDETAGIEGTGCRTAGWVDDPQFLTPHEYNPYVEAAYD